MTFPRADPGRCRQGVPRELAVGNQVDCGTPAALDRGRGQKSTGQDSIKHLSDAVIVG
jgi:hypothetical protein